MTNQSTQLVQYTDITQTMKIAEVFAASGMFEGIKDAAQAAVKIMAGAELGIPPFASMAGIWIIKGKVTVGAHLLAARVRAGGRYDYRVKHLDNQKCVIEFFKDGEMIGDSAYTINDAANAGLASGNSWKQHPQDMLYAAALRKGVRRHCPDAVNGVALSDEAPPDEAEEPRGPLPAMSRADFDQAVTLLHGTGDDDLAAAIDAIPEMLGAPPAAAASGKPSRPLAPDVLRDMLHRKAATYDGREASRGQRGIVVATLDELFALYEDPAECRHALTEFLSGEASGSVKALTSGMVLAILDWLKPSKDAGGAYIADTMAQREALAAYAVAIRAEDQPALIE